MQFIDHYSRLDLSELPKFVNYPKEIIKTLIYVKAGLFFLAWFGFHVKTDVLEPLLLEPRLSSISFKKKSGSPFLMDLMNGPSD